MGSKGALVEERQGKGLVDSSLKHGVQHFVYTSCARDGDKPTQVPHFASKHNIEHHLIDAAKNTAMKWTILQPAAFMENFEGGFFGKVFATAWINVVKSRKLQLVATEDIGRVAAKVFEDSHAYTGRVIELAGDELSSAEMAKVYKEATGANVPTTFGFVVTVLFWMVPEFREMFAFFDKDGFGVDLNETKKALPEVQDLKTWLSKQNKSA